MHAVWLPALVLAGEAHPRTLQLTKKVAPLRSAPLRSAPLRAAPAKMVTGLEGPAIVNAAYIIMAYNFMPLGPTAKGLGIGGMAGIPSVTDAQYNWGNRAFGNMMEQAPLFLAGLWLHALFVSPVVATQLGGAYLFLRLCYPVLWAIYGGADGVPFVRCPPAPPSPARRASL